MSVRARDPLIVYAKRKRAVELEPVLIDNFLKLRKSVSMSAINGYAAATAANDSSRRKDKRSHFVNQAEHPIASNCI